MADDSAKKFNVNKLASDYVVDGKSGREISREARETMDSSQTSVNRALGAEEARRARDAGVNFLQNMDFVPTEEGLIVRNPPIVKFDADGMILNDETNTHSAD